MSMPREMFEKYAAEYQTKISKANQELLQIRAQLQGRQRDRKLTELTNQELNSLEPSTACYRTVGKMY
jgi:prefoldin subunit 1